jgi:hypothetical protein
MQSQQATFGRVLENWKHAVAFQRRKHLHPCLRLGFSRAATAIARADKSMGRINYLFYSVALDRLHRAHHPSKGE